MIDHELLNRVMEFAGKEAYAPPGAAMPPMDPMMMGGGMPPAPQGMPPAPQGMPMDPMAAGAPPGMPMDPMAAGAPPGMQGGGPMPDPSMVGALPPDPAAAGMAPGAPSAGAPIMLAQEDLMDLIEIAAQSQQGGGEMPGGEAGMPGMPPEAEAVGAEEDGRVTNKELAARIDTLEDTLAQISSVMGIQQPAAAGEALGIGTGLEPVPPAGAGALMPDPALPDGGPMMPAAPSGPEKMATADDELLTTIRALNSYT
jgi:hypothetical protein